MHDFWQAFIIMSATFVDKTLLLSKMQAALSLAIQNGLLNLANVMVSSLSTKQIGRTMNSTYAPQRLHTIRRAVILETLTYLPTLMYCPPTIRPPDSFDHCYQVGIPVFFLWNRAYQKLADPIEAANVLDQECVIKMSLVEANLRTTKITLSSIATFRS
jgi:hypothetical protein